MFIRHHRQFSAPCGHHAGRHQGCCPLCSARGHRQEGRGRHVQAARLLLEEEEFNADALEQTTTAVRQRVPSSSSLSSSPAVASQLIPTASSTYEDTVITGLHLQAAAVLNVHQLVNIVLDSFSTNYASWRDLIEQALQHYALIKHVTDDSPSNDPEWIQMDSIILNWISNSISMDLHQVVRERGLHNVPPLARHREPVPR
jgi:hypothetical protein